MQNFPTQKNYIDYLKDILKILKNEKDESMFELII